MFEYIVWVIAGINLVGTVLNMYKNRWGFFLWSVTNIGFVIINYNVKLYAMSILFIIYTVTSIIGFIKWSKDDKKGEVSEWDNECFKYWGRILTGNYKHWCPDWDYLPIDDTVEEFKCCTCKKPYAQNIMDRFTNIRIEEGG